MLKSHYEVLGSNLKLFDVDEQDAGVYVCHANSTADPTGKSAETELLVIGKHGKPQKCIQYLPWFVVGYNSYSRNCVFSIPELWRGDLKHSISLKY